MLLGSFKRMLADDYLMAVTMVCISILSIGLILIFVGHVYCAFGNCQRPHKDTNEPYQPRRPHRTHPRRHQITRIWIETGNRHGTYADDYPLGRQGLSAVHVRPTDVSCSSSPIQPILTNNFQNEFEAKLFGQAGSRLCCRWIRCHADLVVCCLVPTFQPLLAGSS